MKKKELQIASQMLELNPAAALLLDARRNGLSVVSANQALAELTGFSVAEMIDQPWRRFSASDSQPFKESNEHNSDGSDDAPGSRLLSRNHQNNSDGVKINFSPIYDERSKLTAWYGVAAELPANGQTGINTPLSTEDVSLATRKRAGRDLATGLLNTETFAAALQREWLNGAREQRELSSIVVHVDYFSEYRDVFGKHAGDACLRKVASAITGSLRRSADVSARLDDDSFVVLLSDTSAEHAAVVAERIASKVRRLGVHHPRSKVARFVTVSHGIAAVVPGWEGGSDALLNKARAAFSNSDDGSAQNSGSILSA